MYLYIKTAQDNAITQLNVGGNERKMWPRLTRNRQETLPDIRNMEHNIGAVNFLSAQNNTKLRLEMLKLVCWGGWGQQSGEDVHWDREDDGAVVDLCDGLQ